LVWSLPWMLLRCKAFSRDTPIIPLISSSGNVLGSDYARVLLGESLGYGVANLSARFSLFAKAFPNKFRRKIGETA
jgi:hypothetical protein